MDSDVKEVKVTGDAAEFLIPSKKRTRRSKKTPLPDLDEPIMKQDAMPAVPAAPAAAAPAPAAALAPAVAPAAAPAAVTIKPATLKPATLKPATLKPATLKPATLKPATPKPATLKPAVSDLKKPSLSLTRKKRTFKAKNIQFTIAEADPKTRKARKQITKKVSAMSLDELRKELEEKGLIKKGKKNVPEEMLRSMMRDAILLQN